MIGRIKKHDRFRVVLGLSAAGMTYDEMTHYVGVTTRQRVQQLVVNAVATLPQLAERLNVTGRRHPGRRPKEDPEAQVQREGATIKPRSPQASVQARHVATARELLNQHGGRYPGASEMLRLGLGALYQFMRKYPHAFERLIRERGVGSVAARRKRRRRRRF